MTNLDQALAEISAIRGQMARATAFRGYGPLTAAMTGMMAILAAFAQGRWLADPLNHPFAYLVLWVVTASASAAVVGIEMITRSRRLHSRLADDMIRAAIEQLLPAAAAGGLMTLVIVRFAPECLWMLPGLWQIVFSLGVFASRRFLAGPLAIVGVWYLASGLICLILARGDHGLSPWAMGAPFGVGQWLAAGLLQRGLEDDDARS